MDVFAKVPKSGETLGGEIRFALHEFCPRFHRLFVVSGDQRCVLDQRGEIVVGDRA